MPQSDTGENKGSVAVQYFLDTVETIPEGVGWSLFSGDHFLWLGILVVFAAVMSIQYKKRDAERHLFF